MRKEFSDLLDLMFEENESVCVSPNKFAYHSVPIRDLKLGSVGLALNTEPEEVNYYDANDMLLMAVNPIRGPRADENCTAFRSFLIEVDFGPLSEQHEYIKKMGMPFTSCVFSGNKSLHFGLTLDEDLTSIETYRYFSRYILNIMTLADQNTLNPSRGIRVPGGIREGKEQRLVSLKSRIPMVELTAWLSQWPELAPKPFKVPEERFAPGSVSVEQALKHLKPWMAQALLSGIDRSVKGGRNKTWFIIASELSSFGLGYYDIIDVLGPYFQADHDFGRSEWERTIRSASERFGK